jgi:hypothetical protein
LKAWLQFALIALFAVATLYGGWLVLQPSIEAGDVFFKGQSKYMLLLFIAYVLVICSLATLAAVVVWRRRGGNVFKGLG